MTTQTLILGITGGFGFFAAQALARAGHHIHALTRDPEGAAARTALRGADFAVQWHRGDALDAGAVRQAARGCRVIIHGVNPPGYRRWREDAVPMLAHSIDAAREEGARLVLPGNLYIFSPRSGRLVDEAASTDPQTGKGAIRQEMEAMLDVPGLRSLVLRAGDYFAPEYAQSWFGQIPQRRAGRLRAARDLGTPGVGHSWAYLPDLAETLARLLARDAALTPRAVFHFEGHWLADGVVMAEAVARVGGGVPVRRFPWWLMRLIAPASRMIREAMEMRWLWLHPLRLDNRQLEALIGPEPRTPLDAAVRRTLGLSPAPGSPGCAAPGAAPDGSASAFRG